MKLHCVERGLVSQRRGPRAAGLVSERLFGSSFAGRRSDKSRYLPRAATGAMPLFWIKKVYQTAEEAKKGSRDEAKTRCAPKNSEEDCDWELASDLDEESEEVAAKDQEERAARNALSPWPEGWIPAGTKVAKKMDPDKVTHKYIAKVAQLTTSMLGGKVKEITGDVKNAKYQETTIETDLCSTVHIGITRRPSRSPFYREMGARIHTSGVGRNQSESSTVQEWLRELSRVVR